MAVTTTFRQASPDEMAREISRCHAVIERYEADLARLRTALEFYAHRPHYAARTGMESAISRDHFGDRARSSLSPAPQPLEGAVKVDAVPARIEWRKRERTFPAVEEPWSVVDYHTGLLIQQHPEKYETRPLYALSAPSLSPAPQPVGEVTDDMVRKAGDVLLYQVNAPEQVIYAAARLAYPPDGEPANLLRGLRRHLRTAILGCNRCVAKARNQ